MHARQMVELAAVASYHGPVLMHGRGQLSPTGLDQYWAASKCRLDRWGRDLKALAYGPLPNKHAGHGRAVVEEILTSEVLTRVWTALLAGHDRLHGTQDAELIGRSIYHGQLEARQRVLQLLVTGTCLDAAEAVALNRLRRRAEGWTDLLVGHLGAVVDVCEFALCPERAREFAYDLRGQHGWLGNTQTWTLTLASLRAAFRGGLSEESPNHDSNAKIATSILACFEPDMFDDTGMFPSLWMTRLANTALDAQGLIHELFAAEARRPVSAGEDFVRQADRWRGAN